MASTISLEQNTSARDRARAMQQQLDIEHEALGYWDMVWFQLKRDKLTIAAFTVLLILALLSYGAPLITKYILHTDPTKVDILNNYEPPSKEHLLGMDEVGRDQLARLLYGGQISLTIGLVGAVITMTVGVFFGAMAGFLGGWVDDVIMWFINTMSSIPFLLFLIVVSQLFKPTWYTLVIFIALNSWMGTSRLVRGEVLSVKERDYILASRALGVPQWKIIARHVLPNVVPIVIILTAGSVGGFILFESALSFLGLGVQPPTATWGNMLTKAQSNFTLGPHLVVFPGLLITTTVLCLFLIGDGLRDALDPMMRGR
ncbi:MAG: ABC transporter permease [Anaerolineae bacterium]|nr:ABC transporter permease [Anaerolineae bacterium]